MDRGGVSIEWGNKYKMYEIWHSMNIFTTFEVKALSLSVGVTEDM
jgi:hypothetical protein